MDTGHCNYLNISLSPPPTYLNPCVLFHLLPWNSAQNLAHSRHSVDICGFDIVKAERPLCWLSYSAFLYYPTPLSSLLEMPPASPGVFPPGSLTVLLLFPFWMFPSPPISSSLWCSRICPRALLSSLESLLCLSEVLQDSGTLPVLFPLPGILFPSFLA